MANELPHLTHLLVIDRTQDEDFHRGGQGNPKIRPVEQRTPGEVLLGSASSAFAESAEARADLPPTLAELRALGTIITLEGDDAAYPLKVESLQKSSTHRLTPRIPMWLLLSVQQATTDRPERAVVWVADAYRASFLKIFEDYLEKTTAQGNSDNWETVDGNPKNRALVANISHIRAAVLEDLWQSSDNPVKTGRVWWELWLDPNGNSSSDLRIFSERLGIRMLDRVLVFNDRVVTWVEATWAQLELLPFTTVPIAEVRRPEFIDSIEDLPSDEQDLYVQDLLSRVAPARDGSPVVCHLDTGVSRTHVLLADSLAENDLHSVVGLSGADVAGHGTSMAGLALFGPLDPLLLGSLPIELLHRLESVRIIPGRGEPRLDPLDYGTTTIQAVALPEATANRPRVFCLPISTEPDVPGQPTLWSASLDALAAGVDVVRVGNELRLLTAPDMDASRLIVVAAGNVDAYELDHLVGSDTSVAADPAQAWNVLTVGAHTDLVTVPEDPQYWNWRAVAQAGELSPHSRTSLLFGPRPWPIKPDICMEGGNVLTDGTLFEDRHPAVSLRSTGALNDLSLTSANATSAATAQASRLAALAMANYPGYWPETIRALLVHAAEWTPAMRAAIDVAGGKRQKLSLLRRYGWGVPTEDNVLRSSFQAVTLVTQDQFVPFDGPDYKMRRFRLHTLPWPAEVLAELGAADVSMRVTLSYFVEPSASRRGWRQKYSYASHGLRFELQSPVENQQQFIDRVNRDATDDEDSVSRPSSGSDRWMIGADQRNLGSLHQDIWEGSGQELAACNSIAVYPVGGWWKRNARKDRLDLPVRYSLVVSLKTPHEGVDLYTPIANELRIPIETEITGT